MEPPGAGPEEATVPQIPLVFPGVEPPPDENTCTVQGHPCPGMEAEDAAVPTAVSPVNIGGVPLCFPPQPTMATLKRKRGIKNARTIALRL